MTKKIAIGAGHAIGTPGKRTPDDEREWTFNNKVVLSAIKHLKNNGFDILRLDDPTGKRDVPLEERTNAANKWKADILVSVHHNANTGKWGTWTGTETYIYPTVGKTTQDLANAIHGEIVKAYGLLNRGVKKADFHMLRRSNMPAVLTEGGFMDSTTDIKKLRDDKVLEEAGKRIAIGICKHYKQTFKELAAPKPAPKPTPAPTPTPTKNPIYRVIVEGTQIGAYQYPEKTIMDALKKNPKEIRIQRV